MSNPYEPGETVTLVADIFPAAVTPLPPEIPKGVKLRAIISGKALTLAWQVGKQIHRYDKAITFDDLTGVSYRGGQVGPEDTGHYVVQGNGCNCGARDVKNWDPYPGAVYEQDKREATPYGVPSNRRGPSSYTRSRT